MKLFTCQPSMNEVLSLNSYFSFFPSDFLSFILCIQLECLRMCQLHPIFTQHPRTNRSYLILNPGGVAGVKDLKKAAEVILESTGLDPENYRIGNTKAWIALF